MIISVCNFQKDLIISSVSVKHATKALLTYLGIDTDELIIHLVSEQKICAVHKSEFNDPSPTDTITLPIDPIHEKSDYHVLGECFLCPMTAIKYAKENHLDSYEEISLYLVHSILHLAGYNDIEDTDKQLMVEKEKELIYMLKSKDLLIKPTKKSL